MSLFIGMCILLEGFVWRVDNIHKNNITLTYNTFTECQNIRDNNLVICPKIIKHTFKRDYIEQKARRWDKEYSCM